jgi:CRISPR-associated protein Cas8a1/Csx13
MSEEEIAFRPCASYLHQDFWEKLIDSRGRLNTKAMEAPSAFNPGAVVRHNAFGAQTRIDETAAGVLCTCFAMVGCLSLPVNRGVGVLLAPDVTNVEAFARVRPRMTPTDRLHCRVAGPSDAVLQAETRLHGKSMMARYGLAGVYAMQLQPTQWNQKQKSRVHAAMIPPGADERIREYDVALGCLPPKVVVSVQRHRIGRGRNARTVEEPVWFRSDSAVRPLVADNLARGEPWYRNFIHLMRDRDANANPLYEKVRYEREGLHSMATNPEMTREDELSFIHALHRAISMRRGRIMRNTMGEQAVRRGEPPTQGVKNRWERFMEELRLSLINAKTESQARRAISEILARAGQIPNLRDDQTLASVHALVFGKDWERARDLALLALASYKRPESPTEPTETPEP